MGVIPEGSGLVDVLVIGCGVSGLTTGIALLRAGHGVRIWARALPPETTSNVAAAVWYPYRAYPVERVTAWGTVAYREFLGLAGQAETGVIRADVFDLRRGPAPDPEWANAVDGFRHARADELPDGFDHAFVFTAPVIDTSVYLDYLMRTFQAEGGRIERREVRDMADALAEARVVVNCAGLGARELVGDAEFRPLRGQVVRVRHTGARRVLLDDEGDGGKVTYIVPRRSDMILGGTDEEGNESTTPDPAVTRDILHRCARLDPSLAHLTDADILSVAVGIRPVRSTVRLEAEPAGAGRWLVHNYGHGGAGVTLSWGCANEVVRLVGGLK